MPIHVEKVEKLTNEIVGFTCNCCKKDFTICHDPFEMQESLVWKNVGGYGSVFGDGREIELVLCQVCVKEVLGKYIEITNEGD